MADAFPQLRSQPTRDRILAAARRAFAADGYERTTVRLIAASAGCNPALVIRYYGSKEGLFAAAATFDLEIPDLSNVPTAKIGEYLVAHFLDRWERHLDNNELVTLLRASVNHDVARQRMARIFETQLSHAVERISGAVRAPSRAALIASHMLGLGLTRYVLKLPAAVELNRDTIINSVGRTIQTYLTEEIFDQPPAKRKR